MGDLSVLFVTSFQVVILFYFVGLNLLYTFFTIISVKDIRIYTSTASAQIIQDILGGLFYKPLSILVPAYNESETIVVSVKSLLALRYPEFEVVVVNDGSTDDTFDILVREFRLVRIDKPVRLVLPHKPIEGVYISVDHPNLVVLSKKNGGKADALNAGINASSFPLFCCIDADSVLEGDALVRASRLFVEDREVIATGGIVRVLNGCEVRNGKVVEIHAPKRPLECFQAVEYTRGFLSGRTAWNFFNSLLIISGAFGIFRKDIVMAVKGYRETVGEDMDLVVRLHRYCREKKIRYKIVFVPDPVCWTQVPSDLASLRKQRNRWHRGLMECLWHNRRMFLNPSYGVVGLVGYPYFLLVEALGPAVEFTGYFGVVVLTCLGMVNWEFAYLFFALAVLWGICINLGSIFLDNLLLRRYNGIGEILKFHLYSVLEFLGYRQIVTFERFRATFQFTKKNWGKPKRNQIEDAPSPKSA